MNQMNISSKVVLRNAPCMRGFSAQSRPCSGASARLPSPEPVLATVPAPFSACAFPGLTSCAASDSHESWLVMAIELRYLA